MYLHNMNLTTSSLYAQNLHTCREFKIVKIHANTSACSLIANNPITHVLPSMGISVADDIKTVLQKTNYNKNIDYTFVASKSQCTVSIDILLN